MAATASPARLFNNLSWTDIPSSYAYNALNDAPVQPVCDRNPAEVILFRGHIHPDPTANFFDGHIFASPFIQLALSHVTKGLNPRYMAALPPAALDLHRRNIGFLSLFRSAPDQVFYQMGTARRHILDPDPVWINLWQPQSINRITRFERLVHPETIVSMDRCIGTLVMDFSRAGAVQVAPYTVHPDGQPVMRAAMARAENVLRALTR